MHMDVGSILRAKPKPAMSPVDEHAEGATESPTPQPSPLLGVKVNKATAGWRSCVAIKNNIPGTQT